MPDSALPPLMLTLSLHRASQTYFNNLQLENHTFERPFVGANVTLFHALPADMSVLAAVATETNRHAPLTINVTGVRLVEGGLTFDLHSAPLTDMRQRLRTIWAPELGPDDMRPWRSDLTIQVPGEPRFAQRIHAAIASSFVPYVLLATGLALWTNHDGGREPAGQFPFAGHLISRPAGRPTRRTSRAEHQLGKRAVGLVGGLLAEAEGRHTRH